MFERFWNTPDKCIQLLSKAKYICIPYFGFYADVSKALHIYFNYYERF